MEGWLKHEKKVLSHGQELDRRYLAQAIIAILFLADKQALLNPSRQDIIERRISWQKPNLTALTIEEISFKIKDLPLELRNLCEYMFMLNIEIMRVKQKGGEINNFFYTAQIGTLQWRIEKVLHLSKHWTEYQQIATKIKTPSISSIGELKNSHHSEQQFRLNTYRAFIVWLLEVCKTPSIKSSILPNISNIGQSYCNPKQCSVPLTVEIDIDQNFSKEEISELSQGNTGDIILTFIAQLEMLMPHSPYAKYIVDNYYFDYSNMKLQLKLSILFEKSEAFLLV
jgi:hypothetical protein